MSRSLNYKLFKLESNQQYKFWKKFCVTIALLNEVRLSSAIGIFFFKEQLKIRGKLSDNNQKTYSNRTRTYDNDVTSINFEVSLKPLLI